MSCFHKIILTARAQPNIGSRAVQSPPGEVKIFQSFRSNNSHLSSAQTTTIYQEARQLCCSNLQRWRNQTRFHFDMNKFYS